MNAVVYYEPYKLPAGVLALAVHCLFFALLYFGLNWNGEASLPATMTVELWSSLPEEVVVPPEKPAVAEVVKSPVQPEKVSNPEIVLPDKKKIVIKPDVPKPSKKKIVAKPAIQKPVEQKQADSAAVIAAQQAVREQAEKAAAIERVVDEYKAKIMAKIRSNIIMPPDVEKDARAEFSVTLLPGGTVLLSRLTRPSGNAAYDSAVEHAILKSDPLPLPQDITIFNRFRELNLVFKPSE